MLLICVWYGEEHRTTECDWTKFEYSADALCGKALSASNKNARWPRINTQMASFLIRWGQNFAVTAVSRPQVAKSTYQMVPRLRKSGSLAGLGSKLIWPGHSPAKQGLPSLKSKTSGPSIKSVLLQPRDIMRKSNNMWQDYLKMISKLLLVLQTNQRKHERGEIVHSNNLNVTALAGTSLWVEMRFALAIFDRINRVKGTAIFVILSLAYEELDNLTPERQ